MTRLLIVDDEAAVLMALKRSLRRQFGAHLVLHLQTDPVQALALAREKRFALVISDLRMPGMDGLAFLSRMARLQPDCLRLMLTGSADFAAAQCAINELGVFRYLSKPWNDDDLAEQIDAALVQADRLRAVAPHGVALSPQELERLRLEALEPGITHVDWGPNGEVLVADGL